VDAVECPECGYENPDSARFCGQCASSLPATVACSACGADNPRGQRFCNSCGSPLAREPEAAPRAAARIPGAYTPDHLAERIRAARGTLEGERKQVTVLFADVMGSMDLAESVDAETWQRIMDRFFALLSDGVHRFEGTVNKFTGDGIMALFGAPIAHEDHARRACYTALDLADRLATYSADLRREGGLNFSVRMGLNSGEVVLGEIGDDLRLDYTAIGHTVGLAQRMEAVAEPGRAYLTEHTARLVSGYFRVEDLGPFDLKGVRRPVRVFALEGVGAMRTRLDVSAARGFSRFVGRRDELATLDAALSSALAGNGQVVGVVGEPGVGKSRLCYELAEHARGQDIPVNEAHGLAHAKRVPLLPILELVRDLLGVNERDTDQAAREKAAGRLLLLDEGFRDDLPLVFDFLGVADPQRPPPRMDPEARQRQLFAIGRRMVATRSRHEPTVHLLEDLHWFDDASEAFLANLVEAVGGTRTLLLVNFRPEYHADWMRRSYYHQLPLLPLGEEAIDELLRDLLGHDPSLDGLADRIRDRTAGNPFFIEEVVQGLVDSGILVGERGVHRLVAEVDEVAIPPTVQSLLAARIDRLPERDKQLLQSAAVIGRDFTEPVLRRVVQLEGDELAAGLSALTATEFVHEQALYPEAEYAFKHPLTQEVAYGSQLGERRARVHAAVARAIAEVHADKLDERAALLAQHWEQAGDRLEAARWSRRAAAWAGPLHPAEAMHHWGRVRELLAGLKDSPEAVALDFEACVQILTFGWRVGISEQEERAAFAAGRELAERAGDARMLGRIVLPYATTEGITGNLPACLELVDEIGELAEEVEEPELTVGFGMRSYWDFLAGDLRASLRSSERIIELARDDPELGKTVFGFSAGIWCLMFRGALLPMLGKVAEGVEQLDAALRLAREHEEVEILGWGGGAYAFAAWLTNDAEGGLRRGRSAVEIAERLGSSFSRVTAYTQLGRCLVVAGHWDDAVEVMQQAREIGEHTRVGLTTEGQLLGQLAEAHLGRGELELARSSAQEAIAASRRRHTRFFELTAELTLGRVLLRGDGAASAQAARAAFERALALVPPTGAAGVEPMIRMELAELALVVGDSAGRERELREAHRLFTQIGAPGRAAEIEPQLASA
jgi:class 3 adenylate cyclase/tetratricopeptide (TPR) repeat protein